jgi:dTDP-4-dehydrorhamnose reductase
MRILVTGANGLLGQKLSELIARHPEHHLIATARGKSSLQLKDVEYHSLDITEPHAVLETIQKSRPDVIVNAAAMTMVDKCEVEQEACWLANVTSMEHLVKACEITGTHLIHVSTDFIFDGSHGPLDENAIPNPVNFYGKSKLAAEQILQKSNVEHCILRTVLVYGITSDLGRSNIVLWVKESLERGKNIQVVNDQFRTPTLAEDLAMGCFLAATQKAKGVYNISGSDFITPYDIAVRTAEYFKLDKTLIKAVDSTIFKQPARRPLITGFIIDKARKELGYTPHTFEEGLKVIATQIAQTVTTG